MSHVILRLERNAQTGLPHLTVEGLAVSPSERELLERELHRRFGELVAKGKREVFEVRTSLRRCPRPALFRVVQVSPERSQRCPDVVLESVQELSSTEEQGLFCWKQFRTAAEELLGQIPPAQHGPLRHVLSEFLQLEDEPTSRQFLTVVTGYLLTQRFLANDLQKLRCMELEKAMVALASVYRTDQPEGKGGDESDSWREKVAELSRSLREACPRPWKPTTGEESFFSVLCRLSRHLVTRRSHESALSRIPVSRTPSK
jgi:hypothetical protein